MMMVRKSPSYRQLALVAALLLPAACATDPEVGTAVQRNVAFQAVDLDPHYAGVPMEGSDGERSAAAISRYKSGTVKAPPESTTSVTPNG
jgi:type IV pilus biogenesis protein CpaD/CtpE